MLLTITGRRLRSGTAAPNMGDGSAVVEVMTSRHTPPGGPSYGYGWMVGDDGVYSHTGSDGTFAWVDPARRIIQSAGANDTTMDAMTIVQSSALRCMQAPLLFQHAVAR